MKVELKQHFQIESARYLPHLDSSHPCSRMHGHSFKIILSLRGSIDPVKGWLIDYHEVTTLMDPIIKMLDHRVLNEVPGLENPTSEFLARWIFDAAKKNIPFLVAVNISETPDTECIYRPV